MSYYIYILQSKTLDRYYVGYSSNPWVREEQHNLNGVEKYTGRAKDWELKCVFEAPSKQVAISLERFIKRQKSRVFIERLIEPTTILNGRLVELVRVPHLRD